MDLYDADRNPLGKVVERDGPMPADAYLLVVQVCIFNEEGKMLIQQRSTSKSAWGGMWDVSAAGAVDAGETSRVAAMRELREELGLDVDLSDAPPDLTTLLDDAFLDIFIVHKNPDPNSLILQTEEVSDVKWASESEVLEMVKNGTFIPYSPAFLSYLFFRSKHRGNYATDK